MAFPTDLLIRGARQNDIPALIELLRDDALGTGGESAAGEPLPESYAEAFDEISASPVSELYAAEEDNRVVGCFQLDFLCRLVRRGARIAEIESVHVHSDAHRFYPRLGFIASHEGMKLVL